MMSTTSTLSSTLSSMSALNVLSVTSSATSMFATLGVSDISSVTIICLVGLLGAYYILSASKLWNARLSALLHMAIVPMVMTFFLIMAYKVMVAVAH
jgi:hypothetical protein